MQKLIELLTTSEQRSLMVSALRRITVTLTKNTNGHHVIQHCLKSFLVDEVQVQHSSIFVYEMFDVILLRGFMFSFW